MITVTVREKGGQVSRFEFASFPITIGRAKGNDIVLPTGNVTKEHAALAREGDRVMVLDLGSTNGVYINGRRIESRSATELRQSDKLYIGDFILELDPDVESTSAPPPGPPEIDVNDPIRDSAAESLKAGNSTKDIWVSPESEPSHVTVYARGAEVSRRLDSFDVPAEAFELRVSDITESADPSSFRFELGSTQRELVSVRSELHYPTDIGGFGDTVEELEKVEREIRRLSERRGIVEARKQKLEHLGFAAGSPEDEYDASERAARGIRIASSVKERIAQYDAEIVELADQIFVLRRTEARLRLEDEQASDTDRAGTTRPKRIVIARFRAGEPETWSEVKLGYVIKSARWWPVYRVDLSDQGRRAAVNIEALVAQNSGEDWENVTMSFSTSDLNFDARLPKLLSLRLGRAQSDVSTGFRPPPKGTEMLFASFDQSFKGSRSSMPNDAPHMDMAMRQSVPTPTQAAPMLEDATGEYGVPESEVSEWSQFESAESFGPAPGAPAAAMQQASFGGAPPPTPRSAPAPKGASRQSKREAMAPPPPPAGTEPESGWLDFDNLRMAGPRSPRRGKLVAEQPSFAGGDNLVSASETARRLEAVDPVISRGSFDYRYDTDGLADVPSDGMVHRIGVTTAETDCALHWRTVPREDESVYRVAELDNPHDSPLLTGPVEVYSDGGLVTTTNISHVGKGGSMTIGLGVDERIRVARNARVSEESAGLLKGKREVLHEVEVEIRSNLGFEAEVHVFDRIPVTDDDDVSIELVESSPAHSDYDQKKEGKPIRGGMQWSVMLGAGSKSTVEFSYKIVLSAKDEIIGGNRRE